MLEMLAQTYNYTYDGGSLTADEKAGLAGLFAFGAVIMVVYLIVLIVTLVALWKVFVKAGVEGWKAIIPVYNGWVLAEIAGKPGWWGIVGIGAIIPFIGFVFSIAALVLYVLIAIELAKRFGKDTTFAVVGLIIFSLIGMLILGFGDAQYQGGSSAKTPTATPTT